jgi:hypothetical protein
VRRFILRPTVEPHVDSLRLDELQDLHRVLERLEHAVSVGKIKISRRFSINLTSNSLDKVEELRVRHLDVPRQIPAEMNHRYDGFVALQLVPLIADDGELVLTGGEGADVPGDVVAPTDGLNPMNTSRGRGVD